MSRKFLVALAIVAALGAVVYGAYAWYYSITYVWTDDA
jgi:multidrug resistance efflux pump